MSDIPDEPCRYDENTIQVEASVEIGSVRARMSIREPLLLTESRDEQARRMLATAWASLEKERVVLEPVKPARERVLGGQR